MHISDIRCQVHSVTGSSPYELVSGQKPHSVLFPSGKSNAPLLEEDLEIDVTIEDVPDAPHRREQDENNVDRGQQEVNSEQDRDGCKQDRNRFEQGASREQKSV